MGWKPAVDHLLQKLREPLRYEEFAARADLVQRPPAELAEDVHLAVGGIVADVGANRATRAK